MKLIDCMKDWNSTLRLNAASCAAGRPIYYGAVEVMGGRHPDFDALPSALKLAIINETAESIKRTQHLIAAHGAVPRQIVTGLRGVTGRNVIGQIGTDQAS